MVSSPRSDSSQDLVRRLELHADELLAYAGRLTDRRYEAADLLHNAVLVALQQFDKGQEPEHLELWMKGVLRNLWARELEQRRRIPDPRWLAAEEQPSHEHDTDQRLLLDQIVEASERLAPAQREVVQLYLRSGEESADIARRLGRNRSTVRSQLARGLASLRSLLGPSAIATLVVFGATNRARGQPAAPVRRWPLKLTAARWVGLIAATAAVTAMLWSVAQPPEEPLAPQSATASRQPTPDARVTPPSPVSAAPRRTLPATGSSNHGAPDQLAPSQPAAVVESTVTHGDGQVVAGLEVRLLRVERETIQPLESILCASEFTGSDGVVRFQLPDLEQPIDAQLCFGDDSALCGVFEIAPGQQVRLDQVLEPRFLVTGLVVDGRGTPVAEAVIESSSNYATRSPAFKRAETGPDGTFELTSYSDRLAIRAACPGYGTSTFFRARADQTEAELELLFDPFEVVGVARLAGGPPAHGAVAILSQPRFGTRYAQVDEQGHFVFGGVSHEVGLLVVRTATEIAWHEGSLRNLPSFYLAEMGVIEGTVTGVKADTSAAITSVPMQFAGRDTAASLAARTTADADGSYRLEGVVSGPQHVTARSGGQADSTTLTVSPSGLAQLDFDLAPTSSLEGVVIDHLGLPAVGRTVRLYGQGLEVIQSQTDADGRFHFEHGVVRAGKLTVSAPSGPGVEIPPTQLTRRGVTAGTIELRLPPIPPGGIRGYIEPAAGSIAPSLVVLRHVELDERIVLKVGRDTGFAVDGLQPGRYEVLTPPNATPLGEVLVSDRIERVGTLWRRQVPSSK